MIKNLGIFGVPSYCGGFNFNTPNNENGVTSSGTKTDRLQEGEDAHLVRAGGRTPSSGHVFEHLRFL